ncbi:MAG: YlzJ-like protein [Oscillospiraceae bacterium]|nr:YlzJ-like protein [Oscillospiraceae bacterium]
MILHTIIDLSEVMASPQDISYEYKQIGSCMLQGTNCKEGFMVDRIISTNPSDYLNPKYQIGKFLK